MPAKLTFQAIVLQQCCKAMDCLFLHLVPQKACPQKGATLPCDFASTSLPAKIA